ncbi:uncharacterized protein LY89DRAFT_771785 [Mollisia scopiformis]|uniref:Uncharacterized protein n=1 Tax=Mollisia scopiformis TaxID=149040 RepID=A0A194XLX5_MOLSC|nr:uncharacterized protein LY89DRAFT_771785 [Mollisia scopiformis]KUJ20767.1 hypothetical protein LY89DRAFT_771785 [Mollisia scopiformis]
MALVPPSMATFPLAQAAAAPGEAMFTAPNAASVAAYNALVAGVAPPYVPGAIFPGPVYRALVAPAPNFLPPDFNVDARDVIDPLTLGPVPAVPRDYLRTYGRTLWHFYRILVAHVNDNWAERVGVPGLMPWNFYADPIQFDVRVANCWFDPALPTRGLARLAALYPVAVFRDMRCVLFPFSTLVAGVRLELLIIVSPFAKTIDLLKTDPLVEPPPSAASAAADAMGHIMRLVALHLGDEFDPRDWKMRDRGSSLNTLGTFTDHQMILAADAMALLFGYDISFLGLSPAPARFPPLPIPLPMLDAFRARFTHIIATGSLPLPAPIANDYAFRLVPRKKNQMRRALA